MKQTLQRLEVIKNSIMLGDEDIIDLQVNKLSKQTLDSDASNILTLLKNGSFETVIGLIEDYRRSKMGLVSYEDKEVHGLRLELKMMESEYEELCINKITIESMLNDFNTQYYHQCGKLIESILEYRAKFQKKQSGSNPEDQDKVDAFEEAQKDYDDFHKEYEEKTEEPLVDLSNADQQELKSAYRKASSLCHPDKVSDELKEQANEIFKKLNEAYKAKNLEAVKEILAAIQSKNGFSIFSDMVCNREKLRSRIKELKIKLTAIKEEITNIKDDETYQLIAAIGDWNVYFEDMKVNLRKEIVVLQENGEVETH